MRPNAIINLITAGIEPPIAKLHAPIIMLLFLLGVGTALFAADANITGETQFLANTRQLTFEGKRSGEGYFSPDGKALIFQSEREPGNPFY